MPKKHKEKGKNRLEASKREKQKAAEKHRNELHSSTQQNCKEKFIVSKKIVKVQNNHMSTKSDHKTMGKK